MCMVYIIVVNTVFICYPTKGKLQLFGNVAAQKPDNMRWEMLFKMIGMKLDCNVISKTARCVRKYGCVSASVIMEF